MPDRRVALEAIAYGDDPDLKPGERLRAIEMLRDLDEAGPPPRSSEPCRHCGLSPEVEPFDTSEEEAGQVAEILRELGQLVPVLLTGLEATDANVKIIGAVAREEAKVLLDVKRVQGIEERNVELEEQVAELELRVARAEAEPRRAYDVEATVISEARTLEPEPRALSAGFPSEPGRRQR